MSVEDQKASEVAAEELEQGFEASATESGQAEENATSVEDKDWKKESELLAQQVADLKDQMLRNQAEAQNVRRRAEQDVEKAHKFALEKFAKELLPVIDSLEKAVDSIQGDDEQTVTTRQGVELTLSMFLSGVRKFNVEQVDPMGQPFDPALHEAISMVEAPAAEPNSVVAVVQKGYTLNERLVRPAMVVVSKGAPKINEQA